MSKQMLKKEHEYYHLLMEMVSRTIEPKFTKGCVEHRDKGMLWDMSDADLQANFNEEVMDAIVYWAEIQRRQHVRRAGETGTSPTGVSGRGLGWL